MFLYQEDLLREGRAALAAGDGRILRTEPGTGPGLSAAESGEEAAGGAQGGSGSSDSGTQSGPGGGSESGAQSGPGGGSESGAQSGPGSSSEGGAQSGPGASGDVGMQSGPGAGGDSGAQSGGHSGGSGDALSGSGNSSHGPGGSAAGDTGALGSWLTGGASGAEDDTLTEGESGADYVIGEDGETQFVLSTEPETEYIISTPANSNSGFISKTYTAAASAISKTAHTAVESAKPALKTIGFNMVNAVLILVIGIQLAKFFRRMINEAFERAHLDSSLRAFLSSMIYVLTCGVSVFVAMERLGVSSASIIALLGSAGLAISLSLQDFLGNFAGGVIIMILKPFRAGDYIVCGTAEGTVSSTSLFYTTLNTVDNRQMILPNGALSNANIINVTAEPRRRLEIRLQISYDSDIRTAKGVLQKLFDEYPDILHEEEVVVFVDSLGDSGINLVARGWIARENYWAAKWAMTEELKYACDEAGIEIPYNQMDVHIKPGSPAGQASLAENGGQERPDDRGDGS